MYALILAGGKGERLRPLTDTLPKPMAPVCGKPILERQVEWLKEGGVNGVVFLAGYRWEAIRDHFGDGSGFGISVEYSVEDSPLGRGGPSSRVILWLRRAMGRWWSPTATLSPGSRCRKLSSSTGKARPGAMGRR